MWQRIQPQNNENKTISNFKLRVIGYAKSVDTPTAATPTGNLAKSSQITDCQVMSTDCQVTSADCQVTSKDCQVTSTDCQVTTTDCQVTSTDCHVTSKDC